MTVHKILAASVALNALLLASIGYVLGLRSVDTPPSRHSSIDALPPTLAKSFPHSSLSPSSTSRQSSPPTASSSTNTLPPRQPATVIQFPSQTASASTLPPVNSISDPSISTTSSPVNGNSPPETAGSVAVNPAAPGNSIHFQGMRVAVAQNLGTSRGQPSLDVDVTPEAAPNAGNDSSQNFVSPGNSIGVPVGSGGGAANPASAQAQTPNSQSVPSPAQPPTRSRMRVFTEEENLFRTKWGWAAFDQMRRQAALEAANKATP